MTQHTPGPWTLANQGHDGWAIYVRRFGVIALMGSFDAHPEPQAEQAANARLIAAAPQLLESLKEVGEWFALTKPPLDQWEDLAEEFHKETGFMRPGKDYPMGYGLDEEREAERSAAWKQWAEKRRDEMIARLRAAIAAATGTPT